MSHAPSVRLLAARTVAAVLSGRSLKAALAPAEQGIKDPRDRALLHTIVLATIRGSLRWRAALAPLLSRPLPARARPVEAALIAALAQIEDLDMPAHAVVDETVAAIRCLGFAGHAGLGNAILRRWLREREQRLALLDKDPEAASGLPAWWLAQLRADWPDHWRQIVEAGNQPAPMWLRVNSRQISRDNYRQQLLAAGIQATIEPDLPQALRLATPVPVAQLPGFAQGLASVQDGAAQYAAALLAPESGQRVLDACAAPGGKSAHILELCPDLAELLALDLTPARLQTLQSTLDRLQLPASTMVADATEPTTWWDGRHFDRILVDAPCSATGILRRQPDVRLHRRGSDIPALVAQQERLLDALWPLLASGGRLVYAVCSVLPAESSAVLARILAGHDDARLLPVTIAGAQALPAGVQILPGTRDMDGFAYGVLEKR
ncbi:MAG: 16S rRNA (cytosine(967)-C(5))-methyltransferase RsmB [Xanthomonadales bacterium]|nr:16S rRNA (cytosine(967)-C(5))-methyltransferase RsmB [Xanthomonadales bacterium]